MPAVLGWWYLQKVTLQVARCFGEAVERLPYRTPRAGRNARKCKSQFCRLRWEYRRTSAVSPHCMLPTILGLLRPELLWQLLPTPHTQETISMWCSWAASSPIRISANSATKRLRGIVMRTALKFHCRKAAVGVSLHESSHWSPSADDPDLPFEIVGKYGCSHTGSVCWLLGLHEDQAVVRLLPSHRRSASKTLGA